RRERRDGDAGQQSQNLQMTTGAMKRSPTSTTPKRRWPASTVSGDWLWNSGRIQELTSRDQAKPIVVAPKNIVFCSGNKVFIQHACKAAPDRSESERAHEGLGARRALSSAWPRDWPPTSHSLPPRMTRQA